MTLPTPLEMMGAPGSPYTRKMRGVLRYRRIPFRFIQQGSEEHRKRPVPKVPLLPTFYLPGDDGVELPATDTTPLIRRFEREFDGRSVIPPDPALAFLDELIEDYADEWLTKPMFHYRWYHDADATKARRILPHWSAVAVSDEQIAPFQEAFGDRQIGRLGVVGSNEVTAPVIEESYRRFLAAFDAHLQKSRFLFGARPAASDFAVMGQLTCLALFDPTPSALTAEHAPRVYAWTEAAEDLSGIEVTAEDWTRIADLPETFHALLCEVGQFYAPAMLANADAIERGATQVETEIAGKPWLQQPFPYQRKCLGWLRESYAALDDDARSRVDALLDGTGCEALFAG